MRSAFTLIELLVVITIIVVLLALLVPAMDKALYAAEMAVCAAGQRGVGMGAINYAAAYKRRYPYRPTLHNSGQGQVNKIRYATTTDAVQDDRAVFREYFSANQLNCEISGKVDLSTADPISIVMGSYHAWFGWQYDGQRGMDKLGDSFGFGGNRFRLLASDRDVVAVDEGWVHGSHPDDEGVMTNQLYENTNWAISTVSPGGAPTNHKMTWATWYGSGAPRGNIDMQFTYDDGSVRRMDRIPHPPAIGSPEMEDHPLVPVPEFSDSRDYPATGATYIPKD